MIDINSGKLLKMKLNGLGMMGIIRWFVLTICFLFSSFLGNLIAQPFDTLLLDFHSIDEIYPLEDGTFILVGEKDKIVVQRINHKAEPIWSTHLGRDKDDEIRALKVHVLPGDSSIQVQTHRRECDYHSQGDIFIYTVSFSGKILDSIYIPPQEQGPYISLLSGHSGLPRISQIVGNDVVLFFGTGDTMIITPKFDPPYSHLDSLLGDPFKVTMCPEGNLWIFTRGSFRFRYKLNNGIYTLINHGLAFFSNSTREIYCVDEDYFVIADHDRMQLFLSDGFPLDNIRFKDQYINRVVWRAPYFTLIVSPFDGTDTIYMLDQFLTEIYTEPVHTSFYQNAVAIHENFTFSVGHGYPYNEGGILSSEHHETYEGPKYFDVKLLDFELPKYDAYTGHDSMGHVTYLYHFPEMKITLQNNGDHTISNIVLQLEQDGFCPDGPHWQKQLEI